MNCWQDIPNTMPDSSARVSPMYSGDMISYVDLFFIMPSWCTPLACWKAFAPTIACTGVQHHICDLSPGHDRVQCEVTVLEMGHNDDGLSRNHSI